MQSAKGKQKKKEKRNPKFSCMHDQCMEVVASLRAKPSELRTPKRNTVKKELEPEKCPSN